MAIISSYQELWKPISSETPTDFFPEACPCCGCNIEREATEDEYMGGPLYSCGGQYRIKPQIQNHTDKYWGTCPANTMKKLKATGLLDATAVVWAVKENGERIHVASFSHGNLAETFAKDFSKDYPRFWDDESKVDYIEALGNVGFGDDGIRYRKGNMIARKATPHHIKGAGQERQGFKVTQTNSYSYRAEQELIPELPFPRQVIPA